MSLWRSTRNELAGAWRSLQYDLGRRADPDSWPGGYPPSVGALPPTAALPALAALPELPAGHRPGFGDQARPRWYPGHHRFDRPPRRLVAVSVFGALALTGGAGSYVAVVEGLDSLFSGSTGPEPYPLLAEAAPRGPAATAPRGGVPRDNGTSSPDGTDRSTQQAASPTTAAALGVPAPAAQPRVRVIPASRTLSPSQSPRPEAPCDCPNPPVPTPTSPPSSAPSPSPSYPSPTPSPSDPTSPDPAPSEPGASDPGASDPGSPDAGAPDPGSPDAGSPDLGTDWQSSGSTTESDQPHDPTSASDRPADHSGDATVPAGFGRHRQA